MVVLQQRLPARPVEDNSLKQQFRENIILVAASSTTTSRILHNKYSMAPFLLDVVLVSLVVGNFRAFPSNPVMGKGHTEYPV